VFVAVTPGAPDTSLLTSRGFEGGTPHAHPGQGTASTGVFFANAYVELIWLEDTDAAEAPAIRRTHLRERIDLGHEACPFGIGLRKSRDGQNKLPFSTWNYRPPYIPEGLSIPMGTNSDRLDEPLLFLLPWKRGPGYECPDHPNRSRAITRVSLGLPNMVHRSEEFESFTKLNLVEVDREAESLLQVELDGVRCGKSVDLRPVAPLVLSW
jgi:hypothetical protein